MGSLCIWMKRLENSVGCFSSTSLCLISLRQHFSLNHLGQLASRSHLGLPAPSSRVIDIGGQAWIFVTWVLRIQTQTLVLTQQALLLPTQLPNHSPPRILRQGRVPGRRGESPREMGAEASAVLLQAKDPQLLQLEMVRKHSLSECGEGQPYSHDGWA